MSAAQPISPERLAANRANAQLSTGPRTDFGKAKTSQNALKTGLTGRTVLLPSEDAGAYEDHILKFVEAFQPVGDMEIRLVQALADTQWRLDRIPSLEAGMFALGRIRYGHLYEKVSGPLGDQLLDAHILQEDAQHFKNLHLQEARLRRNYRQDLAELQTRQGERQEREDAEKKAKAAAAKPNGFEFATLEQTSQNNPPEPSSASKTQTLSASAQKVRA